MFAIGMSVADASGTAYRIVDEFAPGAQGFVFRVERVPDGEPFVLKHLVFAASPDEIALRTRKLVEAELGRVVSPALAAPEMLVPVASGTAYLMPLCEGADLETLLAASSWSLGERLEIAAATCAVLARLREGAALHGDLSSRNVLVTRGDDRVWRVSLIDLDNLVHAKLPPAPMVGTPEYLPYEALAPTLVGQSSAASAAGEDFAIAVLIHEIVCGAHPFVWSDGDSPAAIADRLAHHHRDWRRAHGTVPSTALSGPFVELFDRGLGPDPRVRPAPDEWLRGLIDAARDTYVCTTCGSPCVNDHTRRVCPACGHAPSPLDLYSSSGRVVTLDRPTLTLGARELGWEDLDPVHVRVDQVGFAWTVTDLSRSGTFLVGARGLDRLPHGERIEIRSGDRLRLGHSLELRVT